MWGNDSYFSLCVSELVEQVVKIAVCVLVLGVGMTALESAMAVAWSFTFSCFVAAVFVVLLYFVYGGKLRKPNGIYKQLVKQSAPITGVRVVGSLVQPIVALILPSRLVAAGYTVSQAMSLYGIALGMTLPLLFLPTTLIGSLSTALVPDISRAYAQNKINHIQKRVETSLNFSLFVSFLIVPLFIALGDKVGVFLYDNTLSGTLLQHAAWIMVPMGLTNISSSILNSLGLEVKSFVNYVVGGVFMFVVLIFTPQIIGIDALVVGMGISATISAALNLFMLRKKMGISTKIVKKLAIFAILSLPTLAITSFVSALLEYCLPMFVNLLLSSMLGVCVFMLFCFVFGVVDLSLFKTQIKNKLLFRKKKNAKVEQ
jgi:stage V sporulation protein B